MASQSDMINITTGEVRCGSVRLGPVRAFSSSSPCIASRVGSGVRTPRLLGPRAFSDPEKHVKRIINPVNMVASALCIE
jgi:hypothetical protein